MINSDTPSMIASSESSNRGQEAQAKQILRSIDQNTLTSKFIPIASELFSQHKDALSLTELNALQQKIKEQIRIIKSETSGIGALFYYLFHRSEKAEKQQLKQALEYVFKFEI